MNSCCPNNKQQGNTVIIALIAVVVVATAAVLMNGNFKFLAGSPTATEEPRINPEPVSSYKVVVGDVNPGKAVMVDSVELGADAYIVVMKDIKNDKVVVGKSKLLTAGAHTNTSVDLSSATKDGDVVYIRLMGKNGKYIENDQKLVVEVTKNVGMLMAHYASEY